MNIRIPETESSKYCQETFDIFNALIYTNFSIEHRKSIRTVSLIERLNEEIKIREAVV